MGIYAGNVLGTGENPIVTASRGELFVPIEDEEHSSVARRRIIVIIAVFCAFAVFVGVVLFANYRYRQSITLPKRGNAMIGLSIAELDDVPEKVTYADVEFAYEVAAFEGIITGCHYSAKGSVDELGAVIDSLLKRYGSPGDFDKMALSVLTEAEIATLGTATWTWDYGKYPAEALEALDSWGSNVAGYYINPTHLYMDLVLTTAADGNVDMLIRYEVRPKY